MTEKATLLALAERVQWLDGPNFATENEIGAAVGFDFEEELGGAIRRAPLPYTASLDAALTLVPEGWAWSVGFDTHGNRAITGPMGSLDAFVGKAATPALALCAAALRARAAQAIEARRAETTGSACESAVGETDASDAALLQQIFDKMAEVVAPLPGIPDAPGQHAGTRAIEPSDGAGK